MGDRRMAAILIGEGALYVYTHWYGSAFPRMACAAIIAARHRLHDPSYATRIIVDQLTASGRDVETGFGLMLRPNQEDEYNNDSPSIIIDLGAQTLTIIDEHEPANNQTMTFEEVIR